METKLGDTQTGQHRSYGRRAFLRMLVVSAGGAVLGACGAPQASDTAPTAAADLLPAATAGAEAPAATTASADAASTGSISGDLLFWGNDGHPLDKVAQAFVKKYPAVKWDSPHPDAWDEKIVPVLASQQDGPDIVWVEPTQIQDWGCSGALEEITQYLEPVKDQFHPLKLAEVYLPTRKGYFGWPGDIAVSGYYHRPDMFEKLGVTVPDFETWTYDDFIALATDVAKQGKHAFTFSKSSADRLFFFLLHQMGGSATDDTGTEITIANEQGVAAMTLLKRIADTKAGLDVDVFSPPYFIALQDGTLIGDFAPVWMRVVWDPQITTPEQGQGAWRVGRFPGGEGIKNYTGIAGGSNAVTFSFSSNKAAAIAFMQYALGSMEGAEVLASTGTMPSYRPYIESEAFKSARTPLFGDWPMNEFWSKQANELSPVYYRRATFPTVEFGVGEVIPKIIAGELSPADGLNSVAEQYKQDVERAACRA